MPSSGTTGLLATDVRDLLRNLHLHGPVLTKSDTARVYADAVAEAASRGFITTIFEDAATRTWRLTPQGLAVLQLGKK